MFRLRSAMWACVAPWDRNIHPHPPLYWFGAYTSSMGLVSRIYDGYVKHIRHHLVLAFGKITVRNKDRAPNWNVI